MAIRTVNELKAFFETGDTPTQQQFWDWLESFLHKNDGITIANVTGLTAALNGKLDQVQFDAYEQGILVAADDNIEYAISNGILLERVITCYGSTADIAISVVEMGGEDILPLTPIDAGWQQPLELNRVFENAATLYISGIPAGSKLLFMMRKFKMNI